MNKIVDENPFLFALDKFKADFKVVSDKEKDLLKEKTNLESRLKKALTIKDSGVSQNNQLVTITNELKNSVRKSLKDWDNKLAESLPMKALSEQFTDRIILLVFGKVNAGKSSFCNFLADQFDEQEVKRFCFKNGKVEYFKNSEQFAEGVTETTATIQGLELGQNLVLLDSPGLHSVIDENGDLTRQFTDSADAVLWLTSSSSPGQVQELKDLKEELEKKKPLQPVITRSDEVEEDWDDEKDDFVQIIKNKDPERRRLQEEDVIKRVKDLGLKDVPLKKAVSISVHAHKAHKEKSESLKEAGLSELFKHLAAILDEAKSYKVTKANQQMLNFLDYQVLNNLNRNIKPQIDNLTKNTDKNIDNLKQKKSYLSSLITANVVSEIHEVINKHKNSRNKDAISIELNKRIGDNVNQVLKEELSEFVSNVKQASSSLESNQLGEFEKKTITIEQVKGSVARSMSGAAGGLGGAAAGAALGSMIMPGVGTLIGSALGGLFGGKAGSAAGKIFIETEYIEEEVGVSTEKMVTKTTEAVNNLLPAMIDSIFDDVIATVESVKVFTETLSNSINDFSNKVEVLKRG